MPDGTKRNIFLLNQDGTLGTHAMFVEQVAVAQSSTPGDYVLCVDRTAGKFLLEFDGKGKTAEVKAQSLAISP